MKSEVTQLMQGSKEGYTLRTTCWECGGHDTLTITNAGEVYVFNCYRASCNCSGAIPINLDFASRKAYLFANKDVTKEQWEVPPYFVDGIGNDLCLKYMESKYMMEAYKGGLFRPMYDPALRRFVFPIRDEANKVVGAIGRALDSKTYPKSHNYNASYSRPFMCGQSSASQMLLKSKSSSDLTLGIGGDAILVEDCASAVSATRAGLTGIALLGTNIRKEFIPYIAKFSKVYIALDADAYSKSFNLVKQLTPYVKCVKVIRIKQDIKDQPTFNLTETIQ